MSKDQYLQQQAKAVLNYYKSGNFKKVIEKGNVLIKKYPDQILFYNATSLALCAIGKFKEALKLLHEASNNFLNNIYIFNNLGMIYFNLNQHDDAKLYLNKALKLNSEHIGALVNLGNVFLKEGNADEAKKLYEKALSLDPPTEDQIRIMSALGNYYQQVGDFKNAEKTFEKLTDIDFNNTQADKQRSLIRKYKDRDDAHLKQMEEKIKKINIDDRKQPLLFALGKAYEDIKNYKKSFLCLKEGNDIANKKINYDIKKDRNLFENLKNFFNELKIDYTSKKNKKIIFILGMPRSGTTLAEQIISSHNKVYGAGELPFLTENLEILRREENLKSLNSNLIDNVRIDYLKKIERFNYNEEYITDKSPLNFRWIGIIKMMFPDSKIIHCKRDAMDTCFSNFKNSFAQGSLGFAYSLKNLGEYYNLYDDLMDYWNNKYPGEIYNLNYEKLVDEPEIEIRNLLNFCNLDWDENVMNHHKSPRIIRTLSFDQANKPISKKVYNTIKNYKSMIGDLIREF